VSALADDRVTTPRAPAVPRTVPAPQTVGQAIAQMHEAASRMADFAELLERLLDPEAPEMHTVVINPANNGVYQVVDEHNWPSPAKSFAVLNAGAAPVFIGIGGTSARAASGAPSCPGTAVLILPLDVVDVELGCDPAVLLANSARIFTFRYTTRQQLSLGV
jgi:hypothetical protein